MNRQLLEAIALRKCLRGVYNRVDFRLAPHILYTRHDQLYLDAVPVEKDGRPPRERKIATFKVDGLKDVAVTPQTFDIDSIFDRHSEKYAGTTLLAVE